MGRGLGTVLWYNGRRQRGLVRCDDGHMALAKTLGRWDVAIEMSWERCTEATLVMTNIAIENDQRNSEFYRKW